MDNAQKAPLYQVWATETATGKPVPVPFFPRMAKEVVEEYASCMRMAIASGNEKRYSNPEVLQHLSLT